MDEATRTANRAARQIDASKEQIDAFGKSLTNFLNRNLQRITAAVREGTAGAAQVVGMLNSIEQELVAAGLPEIISKVSRLHARELQFIRDEFAELSKKAVFAATDRTAIEALIEFDTSRVATHVQSYLGDVRATMMRSWIGAGRLDTDIALEAFNPKLEANVRTELNTSLAALNRSVTRNKAEELGLEKFIYLGPLDKITREFCRERVGKIYTLDEIDNWDNGTDLPANIYCGGYNCRHQLRPVRE